MIKKPNRHVVPKSERGYYPAGAATDPNAPYNQPENNHYCKECGKELDEPDDTNGQWWCDECQDFVDVEDDFEIEWDRYEAAMEDKMQQEKDDKAMEDD